MKTIRTNSNDADFKALVIELDKNLSGRVEERQLIYDQYNKVPDLQTVVVAYDNDIAVGCGAFKVFDNEAVEIKRMFVVEDKRGKGIASAILNELECWAKELSYRIAVLETGTKQHEAIALYQKKGYSVTEQYGPYIGMDTSICMRKELK
jgi:GNAT superfamily N-acetyltransferase